VSTISNIGIVTAITAGLVSFASPCVLPLVPGYVSIVAGTAVGSDNVWPRSRRLATWMLSLCFIVGFSTVFVALGASATTLSRLLRAFSYEANIVGGVVVILFGLFMTGLVRMPWLERDLRYHGMLRGGEPIGAYLLGVAFAFGWTPCIGPVLGAILTVSAVSATALDGVVLLSLYSLGLGIPFFLAALFTRQMVEQLHRVRRAGRALQIAAGGVTVVMGVAMATGQLSWFAFWLLQKFPVFGGIG
jgi:cytochrome c-type biogenesis protein